MTPRVRPLRFSESDDFFYAIDEAYHAQKLSTTLKYKGNLRISWSFDIKYNKNIDLIFFPEDNPYLNYVVLYANDFPKVVNEYNNVNGHVRELTKINIPYNINYDFVKDIFSKSNDLGKALQEKFFNVRFGSVFIPMEIEFEWYSISVVIDYENREMKYPSHDKDTSFGFLAYDSSILRAIDDLEVMSADVCLAIIKCHKILSYNATFNSPHYIELWEYDNTIEPITYAQIFTPLPTSILAVTQTNVNDFIINVRDKPDSKEGKIVSQLLSQGLRIPNDFYTNVTYADAYNYVDPSNHKSINIKYVDMVKLGSKWYSEDYKDNFDIDTLLYYFRYYNYKSKQLYYEKEKSNLINPIENDYLILVWNIESNDWAKVWVLRMPDDNTMGSNKKTFGEMMRGDFYSSDDSIKLVLSTYKQLFLEYPSKFKLYEGYIHVSGLRYLAPFTDNYIKR